MVCVCIPQASTLLNVPQMTPHSLEQLQQVTRSSDGSSASGKTLLHMTITHLNLHGIVPVDLDFEPPDLSFNGSTLTVFLTALHLIN